MEIRTVRHLIANLRRHYGFSGEDILACYDTAVAALFGSHNDLQNLHNMHYVTVSISPSNYKLLKEKVGQDVVCKHPGSNVECLKLFGDLYVRSETRVANQDVKWSKNIGCYTPKADHLVQMMERVTMAASSTKKQIEHANRIITQMLVHTNQKDGKPVVVQ